MNHGLQLAAVDYLGGLSDPRQEVLCQPPDPFRIQNNILETQFVALQAVLIAGFLRQLMRSPDLDRDSLFLLQDALAYLDRAEAHEPQPHYQESYRLAWHIINGILSGRPTSWEKEFARMYGACPEKIFAQEAKQRAADEQILYPKKPPARASLLAKKAVAK